MHEATYVRRRGELRTYFDRTAVDAWKRFASDAPLGRIRTTVREGRTRMREAMLAMLPRDLAGWRILDAGCGAGQMAVELSRRGAAVVAIDLSPEMVRFASETLPRDIGPGAIEFHAGDMLAERHGRFDAVMAMDSLIHYRCADAVEALTGLAARTDRAIVFTFAPRTLPLAAMHMAGRLFPRGDRAPSIEPVAEATLRRALAAEHGLGAWIADRTARVSTGFYTSQVMELTRR
jgi:magnesium-protoporphyrin O-methyltransferase